MKLFQVNDNLDYAEDEHVKKNTFIGKEPSGGPLPTFAENKGKLPCPIWEKHKSVVDCYYKAWELAFGNLRKAKKRRDSCPTLSIRRSTGICLCGIQPLSSCSANTVAAYLISTKRWTISIRISIKTVTSAAKFAKNRRASNGRGMIRVPRDRMCCRGQSGNITF